MAEVQDIDSGDLGEMEAVDQTAELEKVAEKTESELPEKYRGKGIDDVIKMHQEAQKLIDRQSKEVGEVRRLADELIKSQLYVEPKKEKPAEVDFFENPQVAIRRAVESNPKVLAAENYAQIAHQEMARSKLKQLHPDHLEVAQDSEFLDWVKASPIRRQLIQQAENYNVDAADELLSTFKALKGTRVKQMTEAEKTARDKTLKSASVSTGGSGESSQKVYKSQALILLKLRDPAKYAAMQDEIDAAYREDRVR
jgi:hypothetical protein